MITVIAITAILGAAVAVFLRLPLQAYQDAQRRAEITDAADGAFIRIKRDLQTALPNSVRVTNVGAVYYLEFLPTRAGGRYRVEAPSPVIPPTSANTCPDSNGDGLADENTMQFGVADTCFGALGPIPAADFAAIVPNSDFVVVYNLGPGFTNADAYASGALTGGNKSLIISVAPGAGGENLIRFTAHTFMLESPGRRFQIVSGPVSYVCDPGAGTLQRVSGYPIAAAQPAPPGGTAVLLARGITACTITYNVINQRASVVSLWLGFADATSATAANLLQQVQLNNVP